MQRLTPLALRTLGLAALLLLLWNPSATRPAPGDAQPVVLLDASLSMQADGDQRWRAALDSAQRAARGGIIWRFGRAVGAFDTAPPAQGASRLGPALEAAAVRGGEVVVITDGEVSDLAGLAPDLLVRPRVIHLPRASAWDAFVARVAGPARVMGNDTVRLTALFGAGGARRSGLGAREGGGQLGVFANGVRLASRRVRVPDSGIVSTELLLPANRLYESRAPSRGPRFVALEVRLEGVGDAEPRDDARVHVVEVSPEPEAVLLAAPPSWDSRFLAAALEGVARVPLRVFIDPTASRGTSGSWRDGRTLTPVSAAEVARAVRGARLVVLVGNATAVGGGGAPPALLRWPAAPARRGDWYVESPAASPLAGVLAGVDWSALPPATSLLEMRPDSGALVVLAATLSRRGAPRPAAILADSAGRRSATVLTDGLWRWQFRGGAAAVAYRTLVAGMVDWLLGGDRGSGTADRVAPEDRVVPNGMPVVWNWTGLGEPRSVAVRLDAPAGARTDTLRFGPEGRTELLLPPGVYRYRVAGGEEQGVVVVETYSDEWRPQRVALTSQAGAPAVRLVTVELRARWWLFVLAIMAFVAEWAWRRRQGLP